MPREVFYCKNIIRSSIDFTIDVDVDVDAFLPMKLNNLPLLHNRRLKNKMMNSSFLFSYYLIVICISFYTSLGIGLLQV